MDVRVDEITGVRFVRDAPYPFRPHFLGQEVLGVDFLGPGGDKVLHRGVLDLADLIAVTEARNCKTILAGDTGQLQAVLNGSTMSLLADASATYSFPRRSGSAPPGNRQPASGCAEVP